MPATLVERRFKQTLHEQEQKGGPAERDRHRANDALQLLKEGKGDTQEFESLFEGSPEENDRLVAALHWMRRHDENAERALRRHAYAAPPLVFAEMRKQQTLFDGT